MSMVQLNLLPRIKKEFIKAQRTKRLFIVGSILVSGVFVGLVVLLLMYTITQRVLISNLQTSIDKNVKTLQDEKDLDKILTVQNQLNALPELYKQKPATERVFSFINGLVPSGVELHEFNLNFSESTMTIKGGAITIKNINVFTDTIKYAKYRLKDGSDDNKSENELPAAFSNLVSNIAANDRSNSASESDEGASFELTLNYDTALFDINKPNLELLIPAIESTTSATERPGGVFNDRFVPEEGGSQ